MSNWTIGQRCASIGEPSLGLGIVKRIGVRNVEILFPATHTERVYSKEKAPLSRVVFDAGEQVTDNDGNSFRVIETKEQNGLVFYLGETEMLPETDLNHTIVFSRPHQKLLAGHVNKPKDFALRTKAWALKNRSLGIPCRGFIGARIELIPHQLYIAREVAERRHPRVLLSDEVGLGKTVEAGLIFHHLWITGEVKRVLCLVPDQLVTQWLTEFYRKFNVLFNIMTTEHAEDLTSTHPDLNPYQAHQCILQSIDQVCSEPELRDQIAETEWDLVIVDEAHHLLWSEKESSIQYELVEELSRVSGGLLLLTATPRQLGLESHFGRLKLLDPERFDNFQRFQEEADLYNQLAAIADRALAGKATGLREEVSKLFPKDVDLIEKIPEGDLFESERAASFLRALIDRHGTGRMVYRNHRKVLAGFPEREVIPVPLPGNESYDAFIGIGMAVLEQPRTAQRMLAGAAACGETAFAGNARQNRELSKKAWREDPRLKWLLPFLRDNGDDKFLLICSSKSVVLALQEWLGLAKDLEIAVFHEDLNLIERDRQAAYFAKEDGARILLCSEIGSEGRNFQFAHKLILFDLPLNPALLEQRIGRLDRIGQHHDIEIYVPYPEESPLDYLFQWYHRGLNALGQHLLEGDYIYEYFSEQINTIFHAVNEPKLIEDFIETSRHFAAELREKLEKGRDRLLELHSYDQERARQLVDMIETVERNEELKTFMDETFDLFGVSVEDDEKLASQIVQPSPQMFVESFPELPDDGAHITYNRETAVTREDLTFLSLDHPMVTGATDLLLTMERGITSFAIWKQAPEPGILLRCLYVLEIQGVDEYQLGRYLPPEPFMIAVDQSKTARPDLAETIAEIKLEHGPVSKLHKQRAALTEIVESLIAVAEKEAERKGQALLLDAEQKALTSHKQEYDRLKALQKINPGVRSDELDYVEERLNLIFDCLESSKTRLDAVQMVMMVPK